MNTLKEFQILLYQWIKILIAPKKLFKLLRTYIINPIRYGKPRETILFLDKSKKLCYIVNSKAACTSIKATMYHTELKDKALHTFFNEYNSTDLSLLHDYYCFTFVRNPFSRLVSLYRERIEFPQKKDYYHKLYFGWLFRSENFNQFVKRVTKIPDFWADRHFISQYVEITSNGKHSPNYIGKFESINEDFEIIKNKFNLSTLPHYNSSKKYDYKDYYTKRLVKKVYKRYRKDISMFGYHEVYLHLLENLENKENHVKSRS